MRQLSSQWKIARWQLLSALAHAPLLLAVYCLAFWLRFDGHIDASRWDQIFSTATVVLVIKLSVFGWLRVLASWRRSGTFHDLVALMKASLISSLLVVAADYFLYSASQIPRSVVAFDWALTILIIGGIQSLIRLLSERSSFNFWLGNQTRVFIVGTSDAGEQLLRAIRRNPKLTYRVVGFIAQHDALIGASLAGVPILGTLDEACTLAIRHNVDELLITTGDLPGTLIRQLDDACRDVGVNIKLLPSYEQLLRGNVNVQPRTVSIEDLLRREPVELTTDELFRWLSDRVVLVTGSAGSIGSEIARQLLAFAPQKLVLVDQSETGQFYLDRELREMACGVDVEILIADIGDVQRMQAIMQRHRPDVVFHAAAYKHVPLMEDNPGEAIKNITMTTRVLADLADQFNIDSFVMISTDKAVNPTSIMGSCKRVAELYIQSLAAQSRCRFVTVRFGNVLDSAGSVVPIFREQIARGGPITVTHPEMRRYFMTIPEASQLVIQAGAMGRGGEIFVLDMGPPVKIVDLAADIIRLSGFEVGHDIEIKFVGLRPGEKLYEELNADGEEHLNTGHPKILVANSVRRDLQEVTDLIAQLEQISNDSNTVIKQTLQQLAPEYRPTAIEEVPVARAA